MWRVNLRRPRERRTGYVVHVDSAEAGAPRLTAEWVGDGEPRTRKPDTVRLNLPPQQRALLDEEIEKWQEVLDKLKEAGD